MLLLARSTAWRGPDEREAVPRSRFTGSNDTSDRSLPHACANAFEGALYLKPAPALPATTETDSMRAPPAGNCTLPGARAEGDRVFDRGLILTSQAIRRQLAAMPYDLYLIRLIHQPTHRPFPGERLWTASQLMSLATVRFLRARNREGCDIYIHPYAEDRNSGYILVDLDRAEPAVVAAMCAQGHEPCVVLQTSPGHLQAWVRVSFTPVPPAIATAIGKHLAQLYGGDRASTDWRHLGRLAGFTNRKPQRRTRVGAPWVRVVSTYFGLARRASELLQAAAASLSESSQPWHLRPERVPGSQPDADSAFTVAEATAIYRTWMYRWHIEERFAPPDWSIVDLWIARALLAQGVPPDHVQCILRLASPHFPRRHSNPDDYLRRTVARARFLFLPPAAAPCVAHDRTSATARANRVSSNSAGGQ